MDRAKVIWTAYMLYRSRLRGFDLSVIESVVRHSGERYQDTTTGSLIAVGRHNADLIMIPYEKSDGRVTPLTVHVTTRRQINSRLRSGRFKHE
jgi:hypothetical protein